MMRGIPKNVKGERVRLALLEARPAGLSTKQLITVTELTGSQVGSGLVDIKERAAAEHLTPLTWTRLDGHRFSEEPADWIAYERAQIHTNLTRISRLIKGTAYPHAERNPEDDWIRLVLDQLNGVRATLEALTHQ
jgi:hypothetical protein